MVQIIWTATLWCWGQRASLVALSSVHWASTVEKHRTAENSQGQGELRALMPTRELLVKGSASRQHPLLLGDRP